MHSFLQRRGDYDYICVPEHQLKVLQFGLSGVTVLEDVKNAMQYCANKTKSVEIFIYFQWILTIVYYTATQF